MVFGLACEIPFHSEELFIPWFLHSEVDPETKQGCFPDVLETDQVGIYFIATIIKF